MHGAILVVRLLYISLVSTCVDLCTAIALILRFDGRFYKKKNDRLQDVDDQNSPGVGV